MKTNDETQAVREADERESVTFGADRNKDFSKEPLCLSGRGVTRIFQTGKTTTVAVDHVDFDFHKGELISIVGESGSGKTTLSKMLLGLLEPSAGEISFMGKPRDISTRAKKKEYWQGIQAIFQDPFSSYNVFHKIDSVLLDCINMTGGKGLSKEEKFNKMVEACSFVNLKFAELTNKYPFELSGGQKRRVAMAGVLVMRPKVLVLDEPASGLDPRGKREMRALIEELRAKGHTIIIVSHNMDEVSWICDRICCLKEGRIRALKTPEELFSDRSVTGNIGIMRPPHPLRDVS